MKTRILFLTLFVITLLALAAPVLADGGSGGVYDPTYHPKWQVVCTAGLQVRGAPGYQYVVIGYVDPGQRVLSAEVWQGWTYIYLQKGWVRSTSLCDTWQPAGW